MSAIRNFYKNKNILLTGGTGFVGLGIIEKLLRSFPEINNIYMIVRPKKNQNLSQRKDEFVKNQVFDRIKSENKADFSKLIWLEGDMTHPNLGLAESTIRNLQESVNMIIHSAATINFNAPLKQAIVTNVSATNDLLNLAKGCQNFNCFVQISTLYSRAQSTVNYFEEDIMKHPIEPKELIKIGNEWSKAELNAKTAEFIQTWPNTYTYTKHAAENLVADCKDFFPSVIFRPGSVMASYQEPYPYWVNTNVAMLRLLMETHRGLEYNENPQVLSNASPIDFVVNALLMTAYQTTKNKNCTVYNYSTKRSPTAMNMFKCYASSINNYKSQLVPKRKELLAMENVIPGSKEDLMIKELLNYQIFDKALKYFFNHCLTMSNRNVENMWDQMNEEERKLLPFDLRSLNWKDYICNMYGKTYGSPEISFKSVLK